MSHLYEPKSIGTLEIPNRFVRSATAERLADDKGKPLPELGEMYAEMARGGVGLVISGHAYVHPSGRAHAGMSGIYVEEIGLDRLRAVVDHVRVKLFDDGMECDRAEGHPAAT